MFRLFTPGVTTHATPADTTIATNTTMMTGWIERSVKNRKKVRHRPRRIEKVAAAARKNATEEKGRKTEGTTTERKEQKTPIISIATAVTLQNQMMIQTKMAAATRVTEAETETGDVIICPLVADETSFPTAITAKRPIRAGTAIVPLPTYIITGAAEIRWMAAVVEEGKRVTPPIADRANKIPFGSALISACVWYISRTPGVERIWVKEGWSTYLDRGRPRCGWTLKILCWKVRMHRVISYDGTAVPRAHWSVCVFL